MRTFCAVCLLSAILFTSCNFNKKEDCIKLDNEIARMNDTLLQYGSDWGDELKIAVNTLDFSGLQPVRMEMQGYIDRKIEHVQQMKNVGGSEELLATELEFLKAEKDIVANKLSAFERFTDSVAMDDLSTAYADMQMSAVKENDLLAKLFKLREQYAEKNDIPKFIEKN